MKTFLAKIVSRDSLFSKVHSARNERVIVTISGNLETNEKLHSQFLCCTVRCSLNYFSLYDKYNCIHNNFEGEAYLLLM